MIEAAKVLTVLAVILAGASIHPRFRVALKAAYGCVAGVALCLVIATL